MSVLFVELADPDILKGTASTHLAQNGVMIRADQSYEDALAEVRTHYGLKPDIYTCSFSQRRPDRPRPIFIAPSAWALVEPSIDLELFVHPSTAESEHGATVDQDKDVSASSAVAPATPSNTDESESEVSDSDAEAGPAPAQALTLTSWTRSSAHTQSTASGERAAAGPSGDSHSTPHAAEDDDRARSTTPSPSNRSAKAKLRRAIAQGEGTSADSPSPRPRSPSRSRSATQPRQPLDRNTVEHSIGSHSSFRIGLDDVGNVAFVPPSPLARDEPGPSARPKGKQRARSASPAEDAVTPSRNVAPGPLKRSASSRDNTPRKRLRRGCSQGTAAPSPRVALPSGAPAHAPSPAQPSGASGSRGTSSGSRSAPRKSVADIRREDRRREALARPRVAVPDTRRSSRFHYYLRLPNWPIAPRNEGPLRPQLLFKQGARGDDTFGLTLQFVFDAAAKASGWDVQDLRLSFYPRHEEEREERDDGAEPTAREKVIVWGWDRIFVEWRDLEEIGLSIGDVVDVDHVPYDPRRAYWDED